MGNVTVQQLVDDRILVLDGAMGTMIQSYNLSEDDFRGQVFYDVQQPLMGVNELLCVTRPDVVEDIHRNYLEAGADIIETNSFNALRVSMADYGVDGWCRDINLQAARIARCMADFFTAENPDKPRFVAGAVGPSTKKCLDRGEVCSSECGYVTYDLLFEAYCEQMEALLEGGVDMLLIETIVGVMNAKAAIEAAKHAMMVVERKVPIVLSVTLALNGCLLSGHTLDEFLALVQGEHLFSVGLNCSYGVSQLKPFVKYLAQHCPYYITVYPNAGLPDAYGHYADSAERFAEMLKEVVDEGWVNVIGGCCGTTEKHIAELVKLARRGVPHKILH